MKKYLLLLPLLSNIIAFGQQSKSDEQLDFLKKMMYSSLQMSFPQNATPPSNKIKTDYTFPWLEIQEIDKAAFTNELKNFVNKYEFRLDDITLVLFSSFSNNFEISEKYLSIDIINQQLKDEKGAVVEIKPASKYVDLSYKSVSIEIYDDQGEVVDYKDSSYINIDKSFDVKGDYNQLTGTVTVETRQLVSYNYKKITTADIGKEIIFGSNKMKVLSIKNNVFTYQLLEGDGEFSHFATNKNDEAYKDNTSRSKVSQQDIDFVNSHPNFTQEDVNQYVESIKDLIAQKKIVKNIFVVRYDGNVSNVYLYKPETYITETKVVKVEL
jgi:hypothetical protein